MFWLYTRERSEADTQPRSRTELVHALYEQSFWRALLGQREKERPTIDGRCSRETERLHKSEYSERMSNGEFREKDGERYQKPALIFNLIFSSIFLFLIFIF